MKTNTDIEFIASRNKRDDEFIGLKIVNNKITFYYPITFDLSASDEGKRMDGLAILKSISLAKRSTDQDSTYYNEYDDKYDIPFDSYIWIINDYFTYHRFDNAEKQYSKNSSGKICWKKTIRTQPIINNGNIIFNNIIVEKYNQNDNILVEIYNYCVKTAFDTLGPFFNISFNDFGPEYYRSFDKKKYLAVLNKEISHTFNDQKKMRLNHMKNIIIGLSDNIVSSSNIVYGADSYEFVFEKMVDKLFSSKEINIRDFFPNSQWVLVNKDRAYKNSCLRPDTIMKNGKDVFILDAKFYQYGYTFAVGDLPDTTSVEKQITYAEFIKNTKEDEYDNIYNAFILPYSSAKNIFNDKFNGNVVYIGNANASWKSDENIFKKVPAFLIDLRFLVYNYINKKHDDIDNLMKLIKEYSGCL